MATSTGYLDTGITASWNEDRDVTLSVTGIPVVDLGAGVTGLAFSPASGSDRNGAQLNITVSQSQGFDDRAAAYDSALNLNLGSYTPAAGDAILKAESHVGDPTVPETGFDRLGRSRLDYMMPLIFDDAVNIPATSFFVSCTGPAASRTYYLVSEIDEDYFLSLDDTSVTDMPTLADLIDRFERLQVDHIYNQTGQSVRPKFHMDQYGGDMGRPLAQAISLLDLDTHTIEQKRPLIYALIQYAVFVYHAMKDGTTIWPVNGGHNHGRKFLLTWAAEVLDNNDWRTQIGLWVAAGVFQDDLQYTVRGDGGNVPVYGDQRVTKETYEQNILSPGSTVRAGAAFGGWTDGGRPFDSTYQEVNDPVAQAIAFHAQKHPSFAATWNHSSLGRGMVVAEFGAWFLPDAYKTIATAGDVDILNGDSRFGSQHGVSVVEDIGGYRIPFVVSVWNAHAERALFQPIVTPLNPAAAVSSQEITVEPFGYIDPGNGFVRGDWAQIPADGDYPYISSGVTFRYTLDGTEPTEESTLYDPDNKPVATADHAVDGIATVKVKAFHADYAPSSTIISRIQIAQVIRQFKSAGSGTSTASTTISATFDNDVVVGNIIEATASVRNSGGTGTFSFDGDDWTYDYDSNFGASLPSVIRARRTVEATGETTVTATSSSGLRMAIAIVELQGVVATPDVSASDVATTTGRSAMSTGTTGAIGGVPRFALASWAGQGITSAPAPGARTYTNGFEEVVAEQFDTAAVANVAFASTIITEAGTVDETLNTAEDWIGGGGIVVYELADTTPPEVESATVNATGDEIAITFSEAMNTSNTTGLALAGLGNNDQTYTLDNPVWSEGDTVLTLDITPPVNITNLVEGEPINPLRLSYTAGNMEDAAGNALEDFSNFEVTNNSTQGPKIADPVAEAIDDGRVRITAEIPIGVWGDEPVFDQDGITIAQDNAPLTITAATAVAGAGTSALQVILTTSPPVYSSDHGPLQILVPAGALTDELGNTTSQFVSADADNGSSQEPGGGGDGVRGGGAKRSRCRSRARATTTGGEQ